MPHKKDQGWTDASESLPPDSGLYLCLCCFRPVSGDPSPPVLFPDVQRFLPDATPPRFAAESLHGVRVRFWMPIPPAPISLYLERPESSAYPP